ncbi:hypothetical protein U1Q18_006966 [Sarracenia purpurea var. burkii]
MAPETNDVRENDACPNDGVERHHQAKVGGSDNKSKTSRHPRWTRQETLILIEGKQVAENRGRKSYRSSSVFGSDQLESKWDAVSLFCREHGVSRGTMQCRKRWSNLIGDFKKIKTWESSQVKEEYESFWVMRNDLRREKKLPGFFDREIYDVLDGRAFTATAYPLTLVKITADAKYVNGMEAVVAEEVDDEEEEDGARAGFDRCRYVTAEDGVFSTIQQLVQEGNGRSSLEKQVNPKKTVPPSKKPNSDMHRGDRVGRNTNTIYTEDWRLELLEWGESLKEEAH